MEALERSGRMYLLAFLHLVIFLSQCPMSEAGHKNSTKMSYVCPPSFIRLGHSCYFFSDNIATWQNALFSCKDRESNLTVPKRWEDRNLRNYLNQNDIDKTSRWIGGIYDYAARSWKWGGELLSMRYQSFSKMKKLTPEELQWHCIAMMPELAYRWAPKSCIQPRKFICQTKLKKLPKSQVKKMRERYNGKLNEITAPSISKETYDPKNNDVSLTSNWNPKSYDLRPGQLRLPPKRRPGLERYYVMKRSRQRSPMVERRLKKPFPGYEWKRNDPEGSYLHNVEVLNSGKTGLTAQQIQSHMTRLKHKRDKQIAQRKRQRSSDWLENEPRPQIVRQNQNVLSRSEARTYTVDNNISALHPKTIVEVFDIPHPMVLPRPARGVPHHYYRTG